MKIITKILILSALLLPAGAFAQISFSLGANGGLTAPAADLATDFNSGYNFGAEAELQLMGSIFYADANYNSLTPKSTIANPKNLNITELSVGYRTELFNLGAIAGGSAVFIDAGIGLYNTNDYYRTGSGFYVLVPSASNFGLSGGIGASFHTSASTKIIGKFKYHTVLDAANGNKSFITFSAGVNFKLN